MKSKELLLNGLSCSNCAAKIEKKVKELSQVREANLNFISKKLNIKSSSKEDLEEAVKQSINIIEKIEPDVKVTVNNVEQKRTVDFSSEDSENKKEAVTLIIGAIPFILSIVLKFPQEIEMILYLISYLIVGGKVVIKAFKNIRNGSVFDENFLMTVSTIGAFSIKQYPEAVAVMLFYRIGDFFQDLAVNRSRKSITSLMDIRPDFANIKLNNEIKKVDPYDVNIGDIIVVKAGEKIPLDGNVVLGRSMVDTSSLTGENVPRTINKGDEVLAGFVNKNGLLEIEVTKKFSDSTVSKILDMVQNASSRKAPTENFITKFARYYTPVVVFLAVGITLLPPIILGNYDFSRWLYRALVFLVVSCPCALVVSIPLGFFGGIGNASKYGILIKGSNYLEALNNLDTVVFDKTGTLTKGVFEVTSVNPQENFTKDKLLKYAAYAESFSNHPIAISVLKCYKDKIDKGIISDYEEISGHGVKVNVNLNGKQSVILAGNAKLMDVENIKFNKVDALGTVVYVAVNGLYAGYIVISDEIKKDSKIAIEKLKKCGIKRTVMLTGDLENIAKKVGNRIGIDEVYAELLPHQKVQKVEVFETQNRENAKKIKSVKKIAFVGDGINDAPVIAKSDIGIAMGGLGSDAAIESADIVIMNDEPSKIADAVKIANKTKKIVWENIIFALGIKFAVLIMGALGIATMWEAVFADVGVSLIAVMNSLRVFAYKIK